MVNSMPRACIMEAVHICCLYVITTIPMSKMLLILTQFEKDEKMNETGPSRKYREAFIRLGFML